MTVTQRPAVFSRDGIVLGSVMFAGVLLALIGVIVAIRTASPDQKTLSAIAAIVQGSMSLPAGIVKAGSEGERTSLSRLLPHPPSKQIVLSGPPGSGKTVTLQAIVSAICGRTVQSRRPRRLALYVDLQTQQPGDVAKSRGFPRVWQADCRGVPAGGEVRKGSPVEGRPV
jgi:hypothetical protein